MKKYLIDKLLILQIGAWMILASSLLFGKRASIIVALFIGIIWSILCKPLLLFPLDLFLGKVSVTGYFSSCLWIDNYEFFPKKYYCMWRFYISGGRVDLVAPLSCSKDAIASMHMPPKNQKIIVTYYRFSKLLHSWELGCGQ